MKAIPSVLALVLAATPLAAQMPTPPSEMVTASNIKGIGDTLLKQAQAAKDGIAFKVLLTRPYGAEQLAVRVKSGQGEWHHDFADILIVLEGNAQITTGGELVNPKVTAPGEMRADGIKGGHTQPFRAGDVIRIEPQIAHQILLQPGSTLRYFVVKVKAR